MVESKRVKIINKYLVIKNKGVYLHHINNNNNNNKIMDSKVLKWYREQGHTQEECIGFIDGFEQAQNYFKSFLEKSNLIDKNDENKKQTAVEFIIEEIMCRSLYTKELLKEFDVAKEMEKVQMINFLKSVFQQDGFDYEKTYDAFIKS